MAVKEGMDEDRALQAITINAAEIIGIRDRVGSIEKGKMQILSYGMDIP